MLHRSRILLIYLGLFLSTVALAIGIRQNPFNLYQLLALVIALCFFWPKAKIRYLLLALIVVVWAFILVARGMPPIGRPFFGQVVGVVAAEPQQSSGLQRVLLRLDESKAVVSAPLPPFPKYEVGDRLRLSGEFIPYSDDSYYKERPGPYLIAGVSYVGRGVRVETISRNTEQSGLYTIRRTMIKVRHNFEDGIKAAMPEPYSSLSAGILLGTKEGVSDYMYALFVASGLIHLMALSGYNITVIADALRRFGLAFSAKFSYFFALGGVWSFVLATGMSASVVRAAIMGSLLLIARAIGRQSDALVSVTIAAAVMVGFSPYILVYDLGFQLSFAAMLGLILLAPSLGDSLRPLGRVFGEIMATTLSAQIYTLPLLLYYYGRLSLVAVIANVLVLPFIPYLMILIFGAALVAQASLWLARYFGLLTMVALKYVIRVAESLVALPISNRQLSLDWIGLMAAYLLIFEFTYIISRRRKHEKV